LNKKIRLNSFSINFIITIITISISFFSYISMYNILSIDGKTSSLPSDFYISECDKVTNITSSSRGMVHGSITNDCLNGGKGNDILYGDLGYDMLNGNEGDDQLIGDSGFDKLYGGIGDDDLVGGLGDDLLDGGDGNDVLKGGKGNDKLIGGNGDDTLIGNSDADFYICGPGNDIAVQFNNLEGDKKTADCETIIR
jgi:Ca2+-binding RTX toxin-like protein